MRWACANSRQTTAFTKGPPRMSAFASTLKRLKSNWLRQIFADGNTPVRGRALTRPVLQMLEERRMLAVFPEIDIRGNGQSIVDADATPVLTDHTSFGNADINGVTVNRTYTIANTGAGILNITGQTRVKLSGANASDFKVTAQPTATVAASTGTTTFTVRFDPSATGARTATVTVYNDDDDENPYTFDISGSGTT